MAVCAQKTVLVGVSGGVDSAVSVALLRRAGWQVQGAVIRFSPAHEGAVEAARRAAEELSVPLTVLDGQALFDKAVALPFCRAYCAGRTPNPCVVCNPAVKFRLLAEGADALGLSHIATGHYARLVRQNGLVYVRRAASAARDQSYVLYRLPQAILGRLLLPLGDAQKDDVRAMARENGLSSAQAPDSQEICFIPDGDYAAYIEGRGFFGPTGRFISPEGVPLSPHAGVLHYTVGQRKGLGIALGRPAYVREILPEGDIRLGWADDAFSSGVTLRDPVWTAGAFTPGEYTVKIRSMAKPVPCVAAYGQDGAVALRFHEPQRAPAPGQSAVLYSGELVAGGGYIHRAF